MHNNLPNAGVSGGHVYERHPRKRMSTQKTQRERKHLTPLLTLIYWKNKALTHAKFINQNVQLIAPILEKNSSFLDGTYFSIFIYVFLYKFKIIRYALISDIIILRL